MRADIELGRVNDQLMLELRWEAWNERMKAREAARRKRLDQLEFSLMVLSGCCACGVVGVLAFCVWTVLHHWRVMP